MAILRKPEHFWFALWIGVVVLLGSGIAAEHFLGRVTVGEGPRAPAKIVEAKLLPPFTLPPDAQPVPETVGRPLFVPTRRPSPPPASAAVATMKKGQFVLTGITVTPEVSFAFLRDVAGGKTHSVRKGAQLNGITVDTVEPRRVVLRQGEETEDLPLTIQVPARVAATAAPTGAVPPAPGTAPSVPGGSGVAPRSSVPAAPPRAPPIPGMPATTQVPTSATPAVPAPATGRRRPWINAQ